MEEYCDTYPNEYYIDQLFVARCKELGIEIEDYQHFCNEGDMYEFKSTEDLQTIAVELLQLAFADPNGFRIGIKDVDDTHLIFIYYPDL